MQNIWFETNPPARVIRLPEELQNSIEELKKEILTQAKENNYSLTEERIITKHNFLYLHEMDVIMGDVLLYFIKNS